LEKTSKIIKSNHQIIKPNHQGRAWVDVRGRIWPQTCGVEELG